MGEKRTWGWVGDNQKASLNTIKQIPISNRYAVSCNNCKWDGDCQEF